MEKYIDAFNLISILLTIALFVGFIKSTPEVFVKLSYVVKIIVGLILVYKFNDFVKPKPFTSMDKKICFLAGTYILLFTLGDYIKTVTSTLL
jgi:hypothetical protein